MPDPRDPHAEQRRADRIRAYDDVMVQAHDDAHLDPAEIAACTLCDDQGYRRNGCVCDHVDRTDIAARGMQKVRAALAKGRPA
jgi:hypothetical protein